jgi:hypothetical protein
MKLIILLFTTKIFSFIGATLNTVGFLTFFFWESLEPYRWEMIIGGIILIIISELVSHLCIKRMTKDVDSFDENIE